MLSRIVKRLLSREQMRQLSALGAPSNNNRMYYNDPNSTDELAEFLRERQLLMQKRKEVDTVAGSLLIKTKDMYSKFFTAKPPPRHSLQTNNFSAWLGGKLKKSRIKHQMRHYDKQLTLGFDLAAAHFVLSHDGKVKFENQSDWTLPKLYGKLPIPYSYDPDYIIEKLDLSNTEIEYEGLLNICGLQNLKWLSFKDSKTVNDWTIDKISAEYPSLEYLDISGCEGVSERGLEALYRPPNLKTLVVTNHHNSPAFELTCYMLEDVNPHLECIIHTPERKSQTEETDS